MSQAPRSLPLPRGFALTQAVCHYAAEDLSGDPAPFAGNLIVQLRMDAPPAASEASVAEQDLGLLLAALDRAQKVGAGPLTVGGAPCAHVELKFRDDEQRPLQQLVIYVKRGRDLYTVTGTHREGARFTPVRAAALELAASLLAP